MSPILFARKKHAIGDEFNSSPKIEFLVVKSLVWSESNDQLESECIGSKDPIIARGGSDSIMHVGHRTLTFASLAPTTVKPILFEK